MATRSNAPRYTSRRQVPRLGSRFRLRGKRCKNSARKNPAADISLSYRLPNFREDIFLTLKAAVRGTCRDRSDRHTKAGSNTNSAGGTRKSPSLPPRCFRASLQRDKKSIPDSPCRYRYAPCSPRASQARPSRAREVCCARSAPFRRPSGSSPALCRCRGAHPA